ncbi:Cmc4 protein [Saccharomycopsis crataegensis]|uniref:Cx9C motif-containing protein 4, mitochondrial n=1 Tax=Saccharomycopsis crataegensis TaxID=43959 RepID=A0AAV5QGV0_9ASCO|nr:Cmc4 protein [Saccharomycopsis crataegensis]
MADPCKPQACAIQDCLKQNNYNESKCTQAIDQLYACCSNFYNQNGEEARSPCCPIPRLLRFKIKQRENEMVDAKLMES